MQKKGSVALVTYRTGSAAITSFFALQKVGEQVAFFSLKNVHSETWEIQGEKKHILKLYSIGS